MPYFNIVAQTSENTVVTEYEPVKARSDSYQSEAELEREFIRMLTEQGYEYLPISLTIPVPDIEVQKRTIGILNHFDSLCHSITDGLPAEIEARQRQYEYYRDRLLTFDCRG